MITFRKRKGQSNLSYYFMQGEEEQDNPRASRRKSRVDANDIERTKLIKRLILGKDLLTQL